MLNRIDTRQGTANQHSYSNGNTLPYTGVPFGMNHFVVQTTDQKGSWFFHPEDRVFQGFRLTHQPSPWMGDFSHFLLTPVAGEMKNTTPYHYQSSYRPEEAIFQPHYLKVKQQRYGITSELIPSTYGARIRCHYETDLSPGLILNGPGLANIKIKNQQLTGVITNFSGCEDPHFKMYFVLQFNQAVTMAFNGEKEQGIYLTFDDHLEMSLATSFISESQAQLNLQRDSHLTFTKMKEEAANRWQSYLNKIEVSHGNPQYVDTFYHCLYRLFLFPQKFYELDEQEQPIHYDTTAKAVKKGYLYTNNGFWDTFRTVYPLYSIIIPDEYAQMLAGFLTSYQETGFLPKWLSPDERGLMPGTLIDGVIADAAIKGIASDLMPEFLEAMIKAATVQSSKNNYGRQGTADYLKYGYVPLDYHESVNHTQDYAYSDFCISRVAKTLNQSEIESHYQNQSLNYRHLFDKETGFMRAKDKTGTFRPNFCATSWGLDYAEGSAWQNSFAVYHDFNGLIKEYGGKANFFQKLTDLCNTPPAFDVKGYGFEIHEMSEMAAVDFGQLALSNQPSFHLPYLFNYVGAPASAQVVLKQLMTQLFHSGFTGFPGDEDNGSMSGWYLFSSMGFYPVCPGSGEYVLGIPLFDQVKIHLPDGKSFAIQAKQNSTQAQFVKKVELEGADYAKLYLTHQDIMAGKSLTFHLGLAPTYKTYAQEELPFSITSS